MFCAMPMEPLLLLRYDGYTLRHDYITLKPLFGLRSYHMSSDVMLRSDDDIRCAIH